MADFARSVSWEAPEHRHIEKTNDWYWVVGIIGLAGSVASILTKNVLFGVVILLGTVTLILFGSRPPRIIAYEVSVRGVRVDDTFFPYDALEVYSINEDLPDGPQLIVRPKHLFSTLLIMSIPEEYIDDIDILLGQKLPEVHLQEPLSHRILELVGF
jgi:hypothetical protein